MSKEDIINYVMTTPGNPNRAVLTGMLDGVDGLKIHICTSEEYDATSKTPTIEKPNTSLIYLVPTSEESGDLFDEFIWTGETGERFGAGSVKIQNPDWNENDPTSAAYIENRPFHKEEETLVLWEQDVTFTSNAGTNYYAAMSSSPLAKSIPFDSNVSLVIDEHQINGQLELEGSTYFIGARDPGDSTRIAENKIGMSFIKDSDETLGGVNLIEISSSDYESGVHHVRLMGNNVVTYYKLDSVFVDLPKLNIKNSSGSGSIQQVGNATASGVIAAAFNAGTASGRQSHAEGTGHAYGSSSHAEGDNTIAGVSTDLTKGSGAHAEGSATVASGIYSHAEGLSVHASGTGSHAEGYNTSASENYTHSEGYSTTASGNYAHAEGQSTIASGEASHAEGANAKAYGKVSHAEGAATYAYGKYSHAEGNNTNAYSDYSHTEGLQTVAGVSSADTTKGKYAHAEGKSTTASGEVSHAEGEYTVASGLEAHAEGCKTTASGKYAHAEGYGEDNTTLHKGSASGDASHVEGYHTIASGKYAHAEGQSTIASGSASHAEGANTVAKHAYQHVFGEFNIEDPSTASGSSKGSFVEIVGNGSSSARSNARTLDWSGNESLAGSLTLGKGTADEVTVTAAQLKALIALLNA